MAIFQFSQYLHVWCFMQVQLPVRSQKASVWKTPHFPRGHRLGIYLTKPWYVIYMLIIFVYVYSNIWVWVNTYENTIFSGMNIHKSQLFWCELQGYQGFDPSPHVFDITVRPFGFCAGHPRWFWVFPTAAPLTSGAGDFWVGMGGWEGMKKAMGMTYNPHMMTMKDHERSWKIMKDGWKIMKDGWMTDMVMKESWWMMTLIQALNNGGRANRKDLTYPSCGYQDNFWGWVTSNKGW